MAFRVHHAERCLAQDRRTLADSILSLFRLLRQGWGCRFRRMGSPDQALSRTILRIAQEGAVHPDAGGSGTDHAGA